MMWSAKLPRPGLSGAEAGKKRGIEVNVAPLVGPAANPGAENIGRTARRAGSRRDSTKRAEVHTIKSSKLQ